MKTFAKIFLVCICFIACEREIIIDTGEFVSKKVIEGYIENGDYPWVVITKNYAFFEPLNLNLSDPSNIQNLLNLFITDATVIVIDGNFYDTLKFMINPEILQGKLVWPPVKYQSVNTIGQVGKEYGLKVVINDEIYTATTSITNPFMPDSIWFKLDTGSDSVGLVYALITDNPDEHNYYQYFVKRQGKDDYFVPGYMALWDDSFFNGLQFEVSVYRGSLPSYLRDSTYGGVWGKYILGDTVEIKIATMDKISYNYWQSLNNSSHAPKTNLSNNALGVWCGYGVYYTPKFVCKVQ